MQRLETSLTTMHISATNHRQMPISSVTELSWCSSERDREHAAGGMFKAQPARIGKAVKVTSSRPDKTKALLNLRQGGLVANAQKPGTKVRAHQAEAVDGNHKRLLRLYSLMKALTKEQRKEVLLHKFSQAQRVSFEQWLTCHRHVVESQPLANRKQVASKAARGGCMADVCSRTAKRPCPSKREGDLATCLTSRVRRGTRDIVYTVTVSIGRIRLQSKEERSYQAAQRAHAAMVAIKDFMGSVSEESINAAALQPAGKTFEDRFRTAVEMSMSQHRLRAEDIGLRFCICLPALWLPRPLRTPTFTAEGAAMDAGLRVWRRLMEARGQVPKRGSVLKVQNPEDLASAWARIRKAYAEIMDESGYPATEVARKLDALEKARAAAEEDQLERWNRSRMAEEEKLQRRAEVAEKTWTKETQDRERSDDKQMKQMRMMENLLRQWNSSLEKKEKRKALRMQKQY